MTIRITIAVLFLTGLLLGSSARLSKGELRGAAFNVSSSEVENNFQIEVTTTSSPEDFIVRFGDPDSFVVSWGDGSTNTYTYGGYASQTHTFTNAGVYTIKYSGHVHWMDHFIWPDPGTGTPWLITGLLTPIRGINGLITADSMFKRAWNIPSVPAGFWDNVPTVTVFEDTFQGLREVETLPVGLLDKLTSATTFYSFFKDMYRLKYINSDFFQFNTNIVNLAWLFTSCGTLTNIPSGLFDPCTKNTTFAYSFYQCTNLLSIPPMLFAAQTNVTTYAYCFATCINLTGHTPTNASGQKLWELTPEPTGTGCFNGCTGLSDYADIPADWK